MSANKITIKLTQPIKVGGVETNELTMRRPKVRDMLDAEKQAKGSDAEREITMFANLCMIAPDEVQEIDLADYKKLQEAFRGFTG